MLPFPNYCSLVSTFCSGGLPALAVAVFQAVVTEKKAENAQDDNYCTRETLRL